ncbi:MAG TPA: cytochrome c-type biogenesis protein CcmH [Verrucomicrobiae bacterium]|nr:cytochrome c-type biogenesis protein CcmH [Verrucomicrobiae bacterium]
MKRLAQVSVLMCALVLLMGADNATDRYNAIGGKIMCSCGCSEMLLKCNHVGCPNSSQMLQDLKVNLQRSSNDDDVLKFFRDNWGVTSVVEPASHGFELLAWIMPPAALALGLGLVLMIVRTWRLRPAHAVAEGPALDPKLEAFRARARKETEI